MFKCRMEPYRILHALESVMQWWMKFCCSDFFVGLCVVLTFFFSGTDVLNLVQVN